jgi:hypothetical protein
MSAGAALVTILILVVWQRQFLREIAARPKATESRPTLPDSKGGLGPVHLSQALGPEPASEQESSLKPELSVDVQQLLEFVRADQVCEAHHWFQQRPRPSAEVMLQVILRAANESASQFQPSEIDELASRALASGMVAGSLAQLLLLEQLEIWEPANGLWPLLSLGAMARTGASAELKDRAIERVKRARQWRLPWAERDQAMAHLGARSPGLFYIVSRFRLEVDEPDLWPLLERALAVLEQQPSSHALQMESSYLGLAGIAVRFSVEGYPSATGALARFLREWSAAVPGFEVHLAQFEASLRVDSSSGSVTEGDWGMALDALEQRPCSDRELFWLMRDSLRRKLNP